MGGRVSGKRLPVHTAVVDEHELVRVAVFNLHQAAKRVRALASEGTDAALDRHLHGVATDSSRQARELELRHPPAYRARA